MFCRPRYTSAIVLFLLFKSLSLAAQISNVTTVLPETRQATTDLAAQLRQLYTAPASPTSDAVTEQVRQFYALSNYTPIWISESGPTKNAQAGLKLLLQAQRYGLKSSDYQAASLRLLLDSLQATPALTQQRLTAEIRLTTALVRFSQHLYRGRVEDSALRPAQVTESENLDAALHLSQAIRSNQFEQHVLTAQPTSRSYVRLLWAWQRLLKTDTAAARQLALPVALNLERLRWEPRVDSLYLVVNIPAYSLQVVRGAQVVRSHRIVVGKPETPTPELYSKVNFFQTAPEWRMPHSIATKEILPRIKRNPRYLSTKNFRVYNQAGERVNASQVNWSKVTPADFAYQIRQAPSSRNALGHVVFRFPNPYEVFLHDTSEREFFQANYRALSHGCIRVQHAWALARFLVQRDAGKNSSNRLEQMSNSLNEGETKTFGLYAPVPLMIRYQTCDADGSQLRQLPDIYHRDDILAEAWSDLAGEDSNSAAIR
jgi:murein L,D-transpeptidase YcbB/YkuD